MIEVLLDTNVIVRLLCDDVPEHSAAIDELIAEAAAGGCRLRVVESTLAEAVFVLTSFYGLERSAVAAALRMLLERPGVVMEHPEATIDALGRFAAGRLHWVDHYVAARAEAGGMRLATFDRKLRRAAGGSVWPERLPRVRKRS